MAETLAFETWFREVSLTSSYLKPRCKPRACGILASIGWCGYSQ
jgi:hypothetical protein